MLLAIEDIEALRYERFAWCKAYRPEELLRASRPGSQARREIEQALAKVETAQILGKVVDLLLEMKESSDYNILRQGPWSSVGKDRCLELIHSYQDRWGCANSGQAAAWMSSQEGEWFELTHPHADAVAVVSCELCAFFFDGG